MQRDLFIEGMSHAAATVNIVTTDGPAGRSGVTVSAMCSVTADAPTLLVCVHHKSPACQAIRDNKVFCVNVLRDDQALISDTFAGRIKTPGGDKFECADWQTLSTGAPALARPLVAFDCRLGEHVQWGTHVIFIGEVADAVVTEAGSALIYANRAYGTPAKLAPDFALPHPPAARLSEGVPASPVDILDIGCFVTLGPYFMPRLIARFAADNPEVEIRLSEGAQDALSDGLNAGEFGLALTYEEGLDEQLERESLTEVSPYALLPAAHPLAGKPQVALSELAEEPMVLFDVAPSRSYFTGLFRHAGYEPRIRYRSPSFETVRGLVGNGLGYALLGTKPANSMTYDGKALTARPISDPLPVSKIVVARRPDKALTPIEAAFLDTCKGFFESAAAA